MKRPRATLLGRAGFLLPMLLASACAAVPNLGAKPVPASAGDHASARSLAGTEAAWPVKGRWNAYGDPQLVRALGGFAIPDNQSAAGFSADAIVLSEK
jgi:hypothetical protein